MLSALTLGDLRENPAVPYEEDEAETAKEAYASYTFNGHGWGHLVGMSQWGAFSMAMEGFDYKDILTFYFTDIEIVENSLDEKNEELVTESDEDTNEDEQEDEEATEAESESVVSGEDNIQWSDTGI